MCIMAKNDRLNLIITEKRRELLKKCRMNFSENTNSMSIEKAMKLAVAWFDHKDELPLRAVDECKINPNKDIENVKGTGYNREGSE